MPTALRSLTFGTLTGRLMPVKHSAANSPLKV